MVMWTTSSRMKLPRHLPCCLDGLLTSPHRDPLGTPVMRRRPCLLQLPSSIRITEHLQRGSWGCRVVRVVTDDMRYPWHPVRTRHEASKNRTLAMPVPPAAQAMPLWSTRQTLRLPVRWTRCLTVLQSTPLEYVNKKNGKGRSKI